MRRPECRKVAIKNDHALRKKRTLETYGPTFKRALQSMAAVIVGNAAGCANKSHFVSVIAKRSGLLRRPSKDELSKTGAADVFPDFVLAGAFRNRDATGQGKNVPQEMMKRHKSANAENAPKTVMLFPK